eukprot:4206771-Amphidinium_carterae.1
MSLARPRSLLSLEATVDELLHLLPKQCHASAQGSFAFSHVFRMVFQIGDYMPQQVYSGVSVLAAPAATAREAVARLSSTRRSSDRTRRNMPVISAIQL